MVEMSGSATATMHERPREILVVLGCYRGGTSALARALPTIGVSLVGQMLPAGGCNPTGFWENREILDLNLALTHLVKMDEFSPNLDAQLIMANKQYPGLLDRGHKLLEGLFSNTPTIGFKHPGTSRLLFFWKEVFRRTGASSSYLIAVRNPAATVESMRSNFHLRFELGIFLWMEHLVRAVESTQDMPRVIVDYENLIDQPQQQITRIALALGRKEKIDPVQLAYYADAFINPKLRHIVVGSKQSAESIARFPIVNELYSLLRKRSSDQMPESDFVPDFKNLAQRFDALLPSIFNQYPWLGDIRRNRISRTHVVWLRVRTEGVISTLRRIGEHIRKNPTEGARD